MITPAFSIGDKVMRIDYDNDNKVYVIDKIRWHNGAHIYHCAGQGWAQGWAWVDAHDDFICDCGETLDLARDTVGMGKM